MVEVGYDPSDNTVLVKDNEVCDSCCQSTFYEIAASGTLQVYTSKKVEGTSNCTQISDITATPGYSFNNKIKVINEFIFSYYSLGVRQFRLSGEYVRTYMAGIMVNDIDVSNPSTEGKRFLFCAHNRSGSKSVSVFDIDTGDEQEGYDTGGNTSVIRYIRMGELGIYYGDLLLVAGQKVGSYNAWCLKVYSEYGDKLKWRTLVYTGGTSYDTYGCAWGYQSIRDISQVDAYFSDGNSYGATTGVYKLDMSDGSLIWRSDAIGVGAPKTIYAYPCGLAVQGATLIDEDDGSFVSSYVSYVYATFLWGGEKYLIPGCSGGWTYVSDMSAILPSGYPATVCSIYCASSSRYFCGEIKRL